MIKRARCCAVLMILLCSCAPKGPDFFAPRKFPTARYAFFQSPLGGGNAAGYALKLDKLGRMIIAGTAEDRYGKGRLAVWRFADVGRLDPDFGDRGFAVSTLQGEGRFIEISPEGTLLVTGPGASVRFDYRGAVLEERKTDGSSAAIGSDAVATPAMREQLSEAGNAEFEVYARARTGKVTRLAGSLKEKDGVRAVLWGIRGDQVRLRKLPGLNGGEARAYALAAYENGRLVAAGFASDEAGGRRLAVWSVP